MFQCTSSDELENWVQKIKEVRDLENSQIKHNHSYSTDKISEVADNAADNTINSVVSDRISEAGSVEGRNPDKKKNKSLKKKPSIFRKNKKDKKDKIDE